MKEKPYQLNVEKDTLVLKAGSFRAEKGSVLHEGIYNREFISSLAAAVLGGTVVFALAVFFDLGIMNYVAGGVVFVVSFPLLRAYIFRESFLLTEIDRAKGTVTIRLRKPFGSRTVTEPMDRLKEVRVHHTRIEVENRDAVEFVEKISLQHGTVIPGFGQAEELYSVELMFDGKGTSVFVSKEQDRAEAVMREVRDFVFAR